MAVRGISFVAIVASLVLVLAWIGTPSANEPRHDKNKEALEQGKELFTRLVLTSLVAGRLLAQEKQADHPPWEQFLDWLPNDTETVIVAQVPFNVPKWEADKAPDPFRQIRFGDEMQMFVAGPLFGLKHGLLNKQLQNQKIVCTLEASRNYSPPGGKRNLGGFRYEGCHVIQFDRAADEIVKKVFWACLDKADKKLKLAGEQVAVFIEELEDGVVYSYYVCLPKPGLFLCATNQDFLQQMLERAAKKP